jgi:hypothetical protein
MLWTPPLGGNRDAHNTGAVGSATPGTTVTTGSSSNTKGTPAELIASTPFDAYSVLIMAAGVGANTASSSCALDILIGASTEEILIPDLLAGGAGSVAGVGRGPKFWEFPLYIPAGSRLAAQAASLRTSIDFQVGIWIRGGGYPLGPVGTKVVTYGMGTVPHGTSITPGDSGAEGAWTEVTSATTEDHFALIPSFQLGVDTNVAPRGVAVDIGVGAAAAEHEIAQSYWFTYEANETMTGPLPPRCTYYQVPAGSRLAVRASCNGTLESNYDTVIHGVS